MEQKSSKIIFHYKFVEKHWYSKHGFSVCTKCYCFIYLFFKQRRWWRRRWQSLRDAVLSDATTDDAGHAEGSKAWLWLLPSQFAGLDRVLSVPTRVFLEPIPCPLTNKFHCWNGTCYFLSSAVVQNPNISVFNDPDRSQTLHATLSFNFHTEPGWSQLALFKKVFGAH